MRQEGDIQMVKLTDLKETAERKIRESIKTPTGTINIYEPSVDDFNNILDIQKAEGKREGDIIAFDEATVIRKLFPILTDLDLANITDEELEAIVQKPSVHLLVVQNIVSQIVAEVNTMFLQRIKTELLQTGALVEQAKITSLIPSIMKGEAERTGNERTKEALAKIREVDSPIN